jgi:GxxExxY protein
MDLINKIVELANDIYLSVGPGYNEVIYHKAFEVALRSTGFIYQSEVVTPIFYKGFNIGHGRVDLIVNNSLIIELKAISNFNLDTANIQIKNYMNHYGIFEGLIINFSQYSKNNENLGVNLKYVRKINNEFKFFTYLNGKFINTEINLLN